MQARGAEVEEFGGDGGDGGDLGYVFGRGGGGEGRGEEVFFEGYEGGWHGGWVLDCWAAMGGWVMVGVRGAKRRREEKEMRDDGVCVDVEVRTDHEVVLGGVESRRGG